MVESWRVEGLDTCFFSVFFQTEQGLEQVFLPYFSAPELYLPHSPGNTAGIKKDRNLIKRYTMKGRIETANEDLLSDNPRTVAAAWAGRYTPASGEEIVIRDMEDSA